MGHLRSRKIVERSQCRLVTGRIIIISPSYLTTGAVVRPAPKVMLDNQHLWYSSWRLPRNKASLYRSSIECLLPHETWFPMNIMSSVSLEQPETSSLSGQQGMKPSTGCYMIISTTPCILCLSRSSPSRFLQHSHKLSNIMLLALIWWTISTTTPLADS